MNEGKKSEWLDGNVQDGFTSSIKEGVEQKAVAQIKLLLKKTASSSSWSRKFRAGLLQGDRTKLAQGITLVESNAFPSF